jgi:hypothetical protein
LDVPVWLEITFPSNKPVEGVGSHITEGNMNDFWIPYSSEEECKQAWNNASEGSSRMRYKVYVYDPGWVVNEVNTDMYTQSADVGTKW